MIRQPAETRSSESTRSRKDGQEDSHLRGNLPCRSGSGSEGSDPATPEQAAHVLAMSAAGFVIAAGGIAAANELIFAPAEGQGSPLSNFNWRLIPATGILALVLTGFEKMAPQFGNMLGGLVLLVSLIAPMGNAGAPLENIANVVTGKK